ncbi:calcium-binding protein [Paraburkholderia sp. A3BS-1L]|uniref:calcium-binding protein n=1 Tax=Paraburkholderia sp. A3BS-1L TaxID=3028375 RepID=UPI003DA81C40
MARTRLNAEREHRIEMEVVVDAYTEEERALSWYYYLEEQLSFPFQANVRKAMASSPLPAGEQVSVTALAHEDLCRVGIFVWARWGERDVVAPLAQLVSLNSDKSTRVAVMDWHYWHDQGYVF